MKNGTCTAGAGPVADARPADLTVASPVKASKRPSGLPASAINSSQRADSAANVTPARTRPPPGNDLAARSGSATSFCELVGRHTSLRRQWARCGEGAVDRDAPLQVL